MRLLDPGTGDLQFSDSKKEWFFYIKFDGKPIGVVLLDDDNSGTFKIAGAMCSPLDNFSRKIARQIVRGRIKAANRAGRRKIKHVSVKTAANLVGKTLEQLLYDLGFNLYLVHLEAHDPVCYSKNIATNDLRFKELKGFMLERKLDADTIKAKNVVVN